MRLTDKQMIEVQINQAKHEQAQNIFRDIEEAVRAGLLPLVCDCGKCQQEWQKSNVNI